jgi:hypothetical protein
MKNFIHFFVATIFSANAFATYWPQDTDIPLEIETNSSTGAEFHLSVPITTQYQKGEIYYFRDSEGTQYQGVFVDGDGKNSQWEQMSVVNEESPAGTSPSANSTGNYFSGNAHNKAAGAAISTGIAHALYRGIFDGSFRGEIDKLSLETQQNQQATQNNYKKIAEGVAAQGASVRAALEVYANSLKEHLENIASTTTQYTSPSPEFVTNLRELEDIFQMNRSTIPRRMEARAWGLHMLRQADNASAASERTNAQAFLKYAEAFADIAVGLDPITGPIRDVYEAFTGKNLITGEELDPWSRGFAILGTVTFGFGSKVGRGIKAIRNISKMVDSERAITRAIQIDAQILKRIGPRAPIKNGIYQRLLADFRRPMARPVVTEPKLKNFLNDYWRVDGSYGNGNTAAAYRWERLTGEPVNGKIHAKKIKDSLIFFEKWRYNNPQASVEDHKAVEEIVKDIYAALKGT